MTLNDFEPPQKGGFSDFLHHWWFFYDFPLQKSELRRNEWGKINIIILYLQTGTDIGSRASHEH